MNLNVFLSSPSTKNLLDYKKHFDMFLLQNLAHCSFYEGQDIGKDNDEDKFIHCCNVKYVKTTLGSDFGNRGRLRA